MITIRDAKLSDADRLVEIYSYYVENTAVSFEYVTPTVDEFRSRIDKTINQHYPYLVAEVDGIVVGYAYAGAFHPRAAYTRCCEMTIYLQKDVQKLGLGRKLYTALEEKLRDMGMLNLYACIAYPTTPDEYLTTNSADFHAHIGFQKVADFNLCGWKFGRWYNTIWMEKLIGEHINET